MTPVKAPFYSLVKVPKQFAKEDMQIKLVGNFLIVQATKVERKIGEDFTWHIFKTAKKLDVPKLVGYNLKAFLDQTNKITITDQKPLTDKDSIPIDTNYYSESYEKPQLLQERLANEVEAFYKALELLNM